MTEPGQRAHSPTFSSSSDSSPANEPINPNAPDSDYDDDDEADAENTTVVSLLDDATFPNVPAMLEHCRTTHGVDFAAVVHRFELDFYGAVKLVNYVRHQVRVSGNAKPDLNDKSLWEGEQFLKPVLEDDALLFSLDEVLEVAATKGAVDGAVTKKDTAAEQRVKELEEQLEKVQLRFDAYRAAVEETLELRWSEREDKTGQKHGQDNDNEEDDAHYFNSYSTNDIHETMLSDAVRTDAYRDFIYDNKPLFSGKTVLDVGCGTGIISLFAARAGASRVVAVDNSGIVDRAREIVAANDLSSTVTCVRGRIETTSLPITSCDVLVSEWMGYALLYEAMLPSLLSARDAYLAPDGLIAPSHCTLHLAPLALPETITHPADFWASVYGFDMRAMLPSAYTAARVESLPASALAGPSTAFRALDLARVREAELAFTASFALALDRPLDALDGFALWFDVFFAPAAGVDPVPASGRAEDAGEGVTAFTTGPHGRETHWKTVALVVDHAAKERKRDRAGVPMRQGDVVRGTVRYGYRESSRRELEIEVVWATQDREDGEEVREKGSQVWLV